MSENKEQFVPDWACRPSEQRTLDAQRPNKRPKYGGRKKGTPNKRTLEKVREAQSKRPKTGGRKKDTFSKRTIEKLLVAEQEIAAARAGKKLAIDHMDDMVEYFKSLVALLAPWNADGTRREGSDHDLWFRIVAAFQGFLAMRAPYQTPRMSAVAIVPPAVRQRTTVRVTILNERGEKVFSDVPEDEDMIDGSLGEPR